MIIESSRGNEIFFKQLQLHTWLGAFVSIEHFEVFPFERMSNSSSVCRTTKK